MALGRTYTVSQHKESGLWYAHKAGFDWIPLFGSFCETRRKAQKHAANIMGFPLKEYLKLKELPKQ